MKRCFVVFVILLGLVAGSSTRYDVVRGPLPGLPVGSTPGEVCLATDYSPPGFGSSTVKLTVTEEPTADQAFWYLARATNPCGIGTYGATSGGAERFTSACP